MKSAAEIREKIESLKTEVKELDSKKKEFEEEKIKLLEKIALGDESKKQSLWKLLKKIADVEAEIRVKESQLEVLRDKTLPEAERIEELHTLQEKVKRHGEFLKEIEEMIGNVYDVTPLLEKVQELKKWKDSFEEKLRASVMLNQELFSLLQDKPEIKEVSLDTLKKDRKNLRSKLHEFSNSFWEEMKKIYEAVQEVYNFVSNEMLLIESSYPLKHRLKLTEIKEFSASKRYMRIYDPVTGQWTLYEKNNDTGKYDILRSVGIDKPDWPS
jgi:chromosome segregation ATPase